MLNHLLRKRLTYGYIILLIASVIFINYSLKQDYVDVSEKENKKDSFVEMRNFKVTLEIFEDLDSSVATSSITVEMSNQDSVGDLLHKLRSENLISYEITSYIDSIELNHVNRVFPNVGEKWAVFYKGEDITHKINSVYLEKAAIYSLHLIRSEELQ